MEVEPMFKSDRRYLGRQGKDPLLFENRDRYDPAIKHSPPVSVTGSRELGPHIVDLYAKPRPTVINLERLKGGRTTKGYERKPAGDHSRLPRSLKHG
jgi:hypothetical protein